jgi:hypothetical protein
VLLNSPVLIKLKLQHKNVGEKLFQLVLFSCSAVVGIISMMHHEMWRDESQAFLLARDSNTIADLWNNVRYEGHPILWHLILWIGLHIYSSVYIIQVIHLLIGLSTIWLIIRYSPFSQFEKFLLSFSYFFAYEYFIISRNYGLGVFLILLAIVVFHEVQSNHRMIYVAVILGPAANTNIYALMLSAALLLYFIAGVFKIRNTNSYEGRRLYLPIILFAILLVVALLQIKPLEDRIPKIKTSFVFNVNKFDKIFYGSI